MSFFDSLGDFLLGGPGALVTSGLGGAAGAFPQTQTRNGTQSVTRTTPDELLPLQGDILSQLQQRLLDPTAGIAPIRRAARNQVNQDYAGFGQALRDRFLSAGMGSSGKFGLATRAGELSRLSSLAGVEGSLAPLMLSQGNTNLGLAESFLRSGQGTTTTTSDKIATGGGAGGALSGGLQTLFTLLSLNKQLGGG